ncbi:disease resistance protein RPM1-like [Forsythia ovata]|uniref:Disease resistance protein RPM1-like n=1 Tax=Forsythia ovata TaxID=205694 RepID=A0ABD1VHN4_9LAMI
MEDCLQCPSYPHSTKMSAVQCFFVKEPGDTWFKENIESIIIRVRGIAERHQRYQYKFNIPEAGLSSVVVNRLAYDSRGDALLVEEAELVGIEGRKSELMGWVMEGGARLGVISVAGMGGLGKTTLVKKVYDDAAVKKHFQSHAWITVSESFKIKELLRDTIHQLFDETKQPVIIEEGAMPNLEKIIIQRCTFLESVPSGIEHLTNIQILEFFDMPQEFVHKLLPDTFNGDYRKVAHIPQVYYTYWRDAAWEAHPLGTNHQMPRAITRTNDRHIESIRIRVRGIAERQQRYQYKFNIQEAGSSSVVDNSLAYDRRGDALLVEEAELVGIDGRKSELMGWLVEGGAKLGVISVAGMGGLGKTTLVKKVYDDAAVKKHFQSHAWITVSESFKIEELLRDTIHQLFDETKQPAGKFQRLKKLDLDKLEPLKQVIIEEGAMANLEKIIIQRCTFLESVPSGIEHLTNIQVLEFFDMPQEFVHKLLPDTFDGDYHKVAHIPQVYYTNWRDDAWEAHPLGANRQMPKAITRTNDQRNSL